MKYYKIKLPHISGSHQYPENYNETIGNFNKGHVYYDDEIDGVFTLLIAIPDKQALIPPLPKNVLEVTETEAFSIVDQYDPRVMTITNEAVVRNLEIKSGAGITLSQKELDALDPTKGELGFGMTKNFVDRVTKAKLLEK